MKAYLYILLLVGITCVKQWWQNSNVPDLTTQNFFDVVGQEKWVFVKFYTTWCGYCRKMSPEYEKLFEMVKNSRSDILIRRLEGDSNEDITYAYDIHSFPKLVLYKPGSVNMYAIYQGYRTADEMFKFLEQYALPAEPVEQDIIKIAAVEDKKAETVETKVNTEVKVEEKPKATVNNTQTANNTRRNRTARTAKNNNDTNVEEFKNNTKIEVPVVDNIPITNDTLKIKTPEKVEAKKKAIKEATKEENKDATKEEKKEQLQLRQTTENVEKVNYMTTKANTEKELEEIKFLKDEVRFLSEKLSSMQAEIQTIKTQPMTTLKPHDFVFFGVVLMVILAVRLSRNKLYNKIKVS